MKKVNSGYAATLLGLLVLVAGLCMIKMVDVSAGILRTMSYVLTGLGCTVFGHGVGKICTAQAEKADPQMAKRNLINQKDERSVALSNKAKAKAYDGMVAIFAVLQIVFGLMGVDLTAMLLLNVAYFLVIGLEIYYSRKLNQEM